MATAMTARTAARTRRTPARNHLLAALQPEAYRRVAPKLKRVTLRAEQVVYRANEPIDFVYFPEDAVLCLLTVMENGDSVETATVGREGASWISATIGAPSMPCETIVAIEGSAQRLAIADLDLEMKENAHLRDVLTSYSHALLIHSLRTSACNSLHRLPERCARWILTTLDRIEDDRFRISQEFFAGLLGTSRPTVNLMFHTFQEAGIVRISRRAVRVVDRSRLEEAACECYEIIRKTYQAVGL
jgi:CRP-like cAMP-binding protein